MTARKALALVAAIAFAAPSLAAAQNADEQAPVLVVAVPPLTTPKNVETAAGGTWAIASEIAELIAKDLKWSQRFIIPDVSSARRPSYPEVTAPAYSTWRDAGARALVSGFVEAREDGRLAVGCYLYDVYKERELTRKGFLISPSDWRKAAHKCADAFYTQFTGEPGLFQTRIAYVDESGTASAPVKQIAVQDLHFANHRFVTRGEAVAVGPRWSPGGNRLVYTSISDGRPQVRMVDLTGTTPDDRPLIPAASISFAPAFSPDGKRVAFSAAATGNTDIQVIDLATGFSQRLTNTPGIDTSPSFSPDGRQITFESDRSGSQQIYVMNADGSEQRRISFGSGAYASPRWSPDGERIAFTKISGGARSIGVIDVDGSNERLLTRGPADSAPSWGPSGNHLMFERAEAAGGSRLYVVALTGGEPTAITTPRSASDAAWSGLQE